MKKYYFLLAVLLAYINSSFAQVSFVSPLQHGGTFSHYYGSTAFSSDYEADGRRVLNGGKMSGYLQNLAIGQAKMKARGVQVDYWSVCALLKLGEGEDVRSVAADYSCTLQDSIGRIYIVNIPIGQLIRLSLDNRVARIEAHEMPRITMNKVPKRVGAEQVWQGVGLPQAFTGKGVMSGIMDIGFDFTHPMFSDNNHNLRISRFYDFSYVSPDGTWGKTYTPTEMIDVEHSSRANIQFHGTHVASLMTGSSVEGSKDTYSGISPESNIVLLELGSTSSEGDDGQSSNTANLILGLKQIFDYADKENCPCVINISLGAWIPISESTELIDEAICDLLGPGHIVVASAGNDGGTPTVIRKTEGIPEVRAAFYGSMWSWDSVSTQYKAKSIECDLITEEPQEVRFHFGVDYSGDYGSMFSLKTDSVDSLYGDTCFVKKAIWDSDWKDDQLVLTAYKVSNPPSHIKGKLYHISLMIEDMVKRPLNTWIGLYGLETSIIGNGPCKMFTNPTLTPFTFSALSTVEEADKYECVSCDYTIGWPASIAGVIAVGALAMNVSHGWGDNKYVNDAERFGASSCGPNWKQQTKPDVMVSGVNICGAYNKFCNSFENDAKNFKDVITGSDATHNYIISLSGTSMSSPIVAGSVALWLQAKPDLTPAEIVAVLSETCKYPDGAGEMEFPNNMYGYGEIDVYAGLLQILGIPNRIDNLSMSQPSAVRVKLESNILTVIDINTGQPYTGKTALTVYSVDGKKIASAQANSIALSSLRSGIYAVQINTDDKASTGSTLIRF